MPRRLDGDRPLRLSRHWNFSGRPAGGYWTYGYTCRLCGFHERGWHDRSLAADYAGQHIRKIDRGGGHDRFPGAYAIIDLNVRIGRRLTVVDCRTDFRPVAPIGLRIGDQVDVREEEKGIHGRAIVAGFHAPVSEPLADLTYLWVDWRNLTTPTGHPPFCPAHGEVMCPACAQNPPPAGVFCCEFYPETGMHWDTCAERVRTWPETGVAGIGTW